MELLSCAPTDWRMIRRNEIAGGDLDVRLSLDIRRRDGMVR
jgi:hypothetical protein